jgi:F-type H+-transporting ATPase subunit b
MEPVLLQADGIGALGINLPGLVAQLINFTILLVVFTWLFRRFLFPMLDERRRRIEEGLQASEEAKQRLAQTEQEIAQEIARARQEGQALIVQAQEAAARLRAEETARARAEAEQMLERARAEIQLERDAAINEIRREFADLTIAAAERVIKRSLDKQAHKDLIEEVLREAPAAAAGDGVSAREAGS